MMQIGVLGGLYDRDNVIGGMEGYIYMISVIIMLGYMGYKRGGEGLLGKGRLKMEEGGEGEKGREEGWEMEMEVVILSVMGVVMLIWSNDLITTYIGIELQSLSLYMMTSRSEGRRGVGRSEERNSGQDNEATRGIHLEVGGKGAIWGMKYYILGILSSSILLMGIVMMYKGMGTTSNEGIRMIRETGGVGELGGYMMISGILFKLALPPFHNWAPDVYDGVETRKTTWIAVMGKVSYIIYIYKVGIYEMGMMEGVIVGALIVGSVMGLTQNKVKRLLAYSTINQMGFIMMGVLTTGVVSRVSFIFYNVQYWVTLINSFSIMIALGGRYEVRYISSIYRESPMMLMALVINIYSLIGVPPLIGFFGKQMVISGGLSGGYVGLVTVAIITSVISGAYYLRMIKEVMLREKKGGKRKGMGEKGGIMWVISIITIVTVLYGVNPRIMVIPISLMIMG